MQKTQPEKIDEKFLQFKNPRISKFEMNAQAIRLFDSQVSGASLSQQESSAGNLLQQQFLLLGDLVQLDRVINQQNDYLSELRQYELKLVKLSNQLLAEQKVEEKEKNAYLATSYNQIPMYMQTAMQPVSAPIQYANSTHQLKQNLFSTPLQYAPLAPLAIQQVGQAQPVSNSDLKIIPYNMLGQDSQRRPCNNTTFSGSNQSGLQIQKNPYITPNHNSLQQPQYSTLQQHSQKYLGNQTQPWTKVLQQTPLPPTEPKEIERANSQPQALGEQPNEKKDYQHHSCQHQQNQQNNQHVAIQDPQSVERQSRKLQVEPYYTQYNYPQQMMHLAQKVVVVNPHENNQSDQSENYYRQKQSQQYDDDKLALMRCAACNNLRQIYYRDLCQRCYFKSSKLKRATKCCHTGIRPHYSKGKCRECYLMCYYQSRKKKIVGQQQKKSHDDDKSQTQSDKNRAYRSANRQKDIRKLKHKSKRYQNSLQQQDEEDSDYQERSQSESDSNKEASSNLAQMKSLIEDDQQSSQSKRHMQPNNHSSDSWIESRNKQ